MGADVSRELQAQRAAFLHCLSRRAIDTARTKSDVVASLLIRHLPQEARMVASLAGFSAQDIVRQLRWHSAYRAGLAHSDPQRAHAHRRSSRALQWAAEKIEHAPHDAGVALALAPAQMELLDGLAALVHRQPNHMFRNRRNDR